MKEFVEKARSPEELSRIYKLYKIEEASDPISNSTIQGNAKQLRTALGYVQKHWTNKGWDTTLFEKLWSLSAAELRERAKKIQALEGHQTLMEACFASDDERRLLFQDMLHNHQSERDIRDDYIYILYADGEIAGRKHNLIGRSIFTQHDAVIRGPPSITLQLFAD